MKEIKLELFKFKNTLTIDQLDVSKVIMTVLERADYISEKEACTYLNENLAPFTYYNDVRLLLESLEDKINSQPLVYKLKDLHKKVERQNMGELYRQPIITLLEIINRDDDDARSMGIMNELSMYSWVPEIKRFLIDFTSSPIDRQNLTNSGKLTNVYTISEKVDGGAMLYVADKWFLVSEGDIKQVLAEDIIKDDAKIREIRLLEKALSVSTISSDKIEFKIDEHLVIGLSLDNKNIYLNGDKMDKESTLESIFTSPLVNPMKRDYYQLIEAVRQNSDKIVEADIIVRANNMLKPFNESYVFNYKDKIYLYNKDNHNGSRFYMYESISELIHDIRKEFDCDITPFVENKLSAESKKLKNLDDKEQMVDVKLTELTESIASLTEDAELLEGSIELQEAHKRLLVMKHELLTEKNGIKNEKNELRKEMVRLA